MNRFSQALSFVRRWAKRGVTLIFVSFLALSLTAVNSCQQDQHERAVAEDAGIPGRVLNLEKGIQNSNTKIEQLDGKVEGVSKRLTELNNGMSAGLSALESKLLELSQNGQKEPNPQPAKPNCRLILNVHGQDVCYP